VTTDGHLDATVLAEYDEGLLDARHSTQVADHLAGCASCSAVLGQLGDVRARLAGAPAEIEMPAAIAARIEAALAGERSQPDREATSVPTATIHPFRRRLPQLLAAAATIAAVGFGGYVVSMSGGGDDSAESATSAQGGTDAEEEDGGAGGDSQNDLAAGGEVTEEESQPAPAELRTELTDQIQAVVSTARTGGDDSTSQRLADDCGVALAGELGQPLIGVAETDLGAPGAVLVVVEADGPGLARGFVVPACTAESNDALTELTVPIEP
jgi:hypothetical protein